jgi:galactose-1-phosphate uridylyltransferase
MTIKKSTPIDFRKETHSSLILKRDSSGALVETGVPIEFRFDPLTGRTCRLVQWSPEMIVKTDLNALEKRSKERACPFCPPLVETITPRFPPGLIPGGVIRKGKAVAFPNQGPYDVYGTVVVISDRHFIRLNEFDVDTVRNALTAAQEHIKAALKAEPAAKYHFIAWNYMPPSGGSLVHPHLQGNAGYYPTVYQELLLDSSERYFKEKGTNYWSDLLAQEKKAGERYIGKIGNTEWLTAFAPKGRLSDTVVMFPGKASIAELTADDLRDFSEGMLKVFGYIDELNLVSFNMSTYSGFDKDRFWAHAVITPRGLLLYSPIETSDQFYYQVMQDENICIMPPEEVCRRLKKRF